MVQSPVRVQFRGLNCLCMSIMAKQGRPISAELQSPRSTHAYVHDIDVVILSVHVHSG